MGSFHAYRVQLNGFLQQDGAAGGVLHLGAGQADAAHRAHGHVSQRRDDNQITIAFGQMAKAHNASLTSKPSSYQLVLQLPGTIPMPRITDYFFIVATVAFTVYGQIILKIRIGKFGSLPAGFLDRATFLLNLFTDPFILSGLAAAFLASLTWMAAMTKFPISHAYPFMSLSFVFVLLLSGLLLREPISIPKVLGVVLIVIGTAVAARG